MVWGPFVAWHRPRSTVGELKSVLSDLGARDPIGLRSGPPDAWVLSDLRPRRQIRRHPGQGNRPCRACRRVARRLDREPPRPRGLRSDGASCERWPRENSEPGEATPDGRAYTDTAARIGATDLPRHRPGAVDAALASSARRGSPDEPALVVRMVALASRFGRYGYRRVTALLRQEGWRVHHMRVERLWRQERLKVPPKQPKRILSDLRAHWRGVASSAERRGDADGLSAR